MKQLFSLIFFVFIIGIQSCSCAATEGYCHRVKRSTGLDTDKAIGGNTTIATLEKHKNSINNTKPNKDTNNAIGRRIRSAFEKVHHLKLNHSESTNAKHESHRSIADKSTHCIEKRHPKSTLLIRPRSVNDETYDDEYKDDKFFQFLAAEKGKRHDQQRYGGGGHSYHSSKDNSGKKSKRNVKPAVHHFKLIKDTPKEHKLRLSDIESPIDSFMRLTKILDEMSSNVHPESAYHNHNGDIADGISPITTGGGGERLTEVIYKPMAIDSINGDDVAFVSSNEYLTNEYAGLPQPKHALMPLENAGYFEFTLPNISPLKFLTNAVETSVALSGGVGGVANKDDNDEYEMTCPVHFKRSTDGINSKDNGGVLELCTCHLYRKKKQII